MRVKRMAVLVFSASEVATDAVEQAGEVAVEAGLVATVLGDHRPQRLEAVLGDERRYRIRTTS